MKNSDLKDNFNSPRIVREKANQQKVLPCNEDECQETIEDLRREEYLHNLRWEENMNHLYTWDECGFCDGFINQ